MNRRHFLAAASAAALASCKREAAFARVDPALGPLVPASTAAIACLRLDKLRDTPFHKKYIETGQVSMLNEFEKRTGLNPRTDIWEIVACMGKDGAAPLALLRGKFGGQFGKEPTFDRTRFQRLSHKGYYIIAAGDLGVMFLNTGAAAAGRVSDLKTVIDSRDDTRQSPPSSLFELVGTLPGSAHFWMASESGASLIPSVPESGNLANLARLSKSVGRLTVWAEFGGPVKARVTADYTDPNAARQSLDFIKGLIALGRLRTQGKQAEILSLFDGLRPALNGSTLEVNVEEPAELVDKLMTRFAEQTQPPSQAAP